MQFHRTRRGGRETRTWANCLNARKEKIGGATIYGGAAFAAATGRGKKNLFGTANHDAELVQKEFGPIGPRWILRQRRDWTCRREKNYLHGFTASLALFVEKSDFAARGVFIGNNSPIGICPSKRHSDFKMSEEQQPEIKQPASPPKKFLAPRRVAVIAGGRGRRPFPRQISGQSAPGGIVRKNQIEPPIRLARGNACSPRARQKPFQPHSAAG